jgi:hypothetical protein
LPKWPVSASATKYLRSLRFIAVFQDELVIAIDVLYQNHRYYPIL